ncbi:peptidase domain-containing ABC transporter (plasmid) [Enterobacter asburiae]|uniref:peptidase domain-containing ABC transporter n=1 Tax=Enterobacter asburiae TaxID=61645 RepID=UPI0032AF6DC7
MTKIKLKEILGKINTAVWHRIPVIHQSEASECGLACMAMVCGYYGKTIDLLTLRQRFGLSSRGISLLGIKTFSVALGMDARAVSLDLEEINSLRLPCILHWNFNHFVVLTGVRRGGYIIHDPARGRRVVGREEMSQSFTGVALELWPGSEFDEVKVTRTLKLRTLLGSIHGIRRTLTRIFCLSLIIESIGLLLPVGTQLVMDHAIPAGDKGLLSIICIGLIFFILLKSAIGILRVWASLIMGAHIDVQWQNGLFRHLLNLRLDYYVRRKLGDIQSRFGSLNTLRTTVTNNIVGVIMDSLMLTGGLLMMILYGGWLTGVVLLCTLAYVIVRLVTYTYHRQLSEESLVREARAGSYFMETLYGIGTVKVQGMTERRAEHWLNLKIDAINTGIKLTRIELLFGGINTLIATCEQVLVLWLGAGLVIENQMTIGMFVAFGAFRMQFSERVASLTGYLLQLRMMSLHNERVSDIALQEAETVKPALSCTPGNGPVLLEAAKLSYRYDDQSEWIIHDFNLRTAPGECIAITGASGSGKSTLIKILCGLLEPQSGAVLVNGTDIRQTGINNYRNVIACVMQEDRLFSGSLRENICGFTDDIDEKWMSECARASYIHDVIMDMPMGYETVIGELGEGLSGGQKQRIFIARALYRKPALLFMDEATSHLDQQSERMVNESIRAMEITRIIVAHRQSTIDSADRVIVLNQG